MMLINFEFKNLDFVMFRDNTWAVFVKDPNNNEGIFVCQKHGFLELADYDTNLCCDSGEHPEFDIMVVIRGCKSFTRAIDVIKERGIILFEEIVFDRRKHIDFKSLNENYIVVFRNGVVGKPNSEKEAFITTEGYDLKYHNFDEATGKYFNSVFDIMRIVDINSDYKLQTIFKSKE